uniref:Uncharacterized protein n=1 Tax=Plectus sambesii TaxID=2011161 RepID=A0A914UYC4_9BILA
MLNRRANGVRKIIRRCNVQTRLNNMAEGGRRAARDTPRAGLSTTAAASGQHWLCRTAAAAKARPIERNRALSGGDDCSTGAHPFA